MKSTGIVRRIDDLGRVVIPMELRRTFGIDEKDSLEIFVDEDRIILRKYAPGCCLCKKVDATIHYFYGKPICTNCIREVVQYSNEALEVMKHEGI